MKRLAKRLPVLVSLGSFLAATAACIATPRVITTRTGLPAPERDAECGLELIANATDLEEVGEIVIDDEEQRRYDDPALLKLVKPEACKLGGEFVSGASQTFNDGVIMKSHDIYVVWRKKVAAPLPQKF